MRQAEDGVEYAAKIDKAEARLDWTRPAKALDAHIRGLTPAPGAWFEMDGERIKVHLAEPVTGDAVPGSIIAEGTVACGTGALSLRRVQRAGKPAMDIDDFLRGFPMESGQTVD